MTFLLVIIILFNDGQHVINPTFHMESNEVCQMAAEPVARGIASHLDLSTINKIGYVCRPMPPWFPASNLGLPA
jgi:hypothetical protein